MKSIGFDIFFLFGKGEIRRNFKEKTSSFSLSFNIKKEKKK